MKYFKYLFLIVALMTVPLMSSEAVAQKQVSLTQEQIREVVRKETSKVSRCYAKHAMKQKTADGKVELRLIIKASGKVGEIEVSAPSVRGKKFPRCVTNVAKRWKFPKAAAETEVIYPFMFVHTHVRRR